MLTAIGPWPRALLLFALLLFVLAAGRVRAADVVAPIAVASTETAAPIAQPPANAAPSAPMPPRAEPPRMEPPRPEPLGPTMINTSPPSPTNDAQSAGTTTDHNERAAGDAAPLDAVDAAAVPTTPPTTPPAATPDASTAPVGNLWDRIRRGFQMPDLDNRLTTNTTRLYAAQPDYVLRMSNRASLYLYHIVEEIEKRGMPTELALLPFVESAMQPDAVSYAKAVGLWQFIPSTGKIYSLEQGPWKDERRDVVESTRAALDYLQKLYADFGDWHLALAAYNCGEGGVAKAIWRNRGAGKPISYSALRLPRETQYYVPKLQAIKNIVADPTRYGITLPEIRDEPYFVAISKSRDIDVATAARLAEMPLEDFRALNPAFTRPVIVGAAGPSILLPAERAPTFHANLAAFEATGQPLASWTTHTLGPGETLDKLAQRVGISEAQLREANRVPPRFRLAPGSTVLIPRDESMDEDISADKLAAPFALVPEFAGQRQVTYRVRRGDTLNSVSRRWHVRPDEIVAWNDLRSTGLFAGQRLTLNLGRAGAPARRNQRKPAASKTVVATAPDRAAAATAARQ